MRSHPNFAQEPESFVLSWLKHNFGVLRDNSTGRITRHGTAILPVNEQSWHWQAGVLKAWGAEDVGFVLEKGTRAALLWESDCHTLSQSLFSTTWVINNWL